MTKAPTPYDDSTTIALLANGLLAVRAGAMSADELQTAFARLRGLAATFAENPPLRATLAARFDKAANPDGWDAPVSSRQLYRLRPYAAMTGWVASMVGSEVQVLRAEKRFSFEPRRSD